MIFGISIIGFIIGVVSVLGIIAMFIYCDDLSDGNIG